MKGLVIIVSDAQPISNGIDEHQNGRPVLLSLSAPVMLTVVICVALAASSIDQSREDEKLPVHNGKVVKIMCHHNAMRKIPF